MSGSVSVGVSDLLSLSLEPPSHTADIPGHIQDENDKESSSISAWLIQDQVSETTKKRGRCVSNSDTEEPPGTESSSAECGMASNDITMRPLQKRRTGPQSTCILVENPSKKYVIAATIPVSYYGTSSTITEIPVLVYLCCLSTVRITDVPKVIRWIMSHEYILDDLKVAANNWYFSCTGTSSVWQEMLESEDLKELTPNVELRDKLQATDLTELNPVLLHELLISGEKGTTEILNEVKNYGLNAYEAQRDIRLGLQNLSWVIMRVLNNDPWHTHPMPLLQSDLATKVRAEQAVIRSKKEEEERIRILEEQIFDDLLILRQNTPV